MPPQSNTQESRVGVIAHGDALGGLDPTVWKDPFFVLADPEQDIKDALGRLLDEGVSQVLLIGPDSMIGEVLTSHRRHFSGHATPLRMCTMKFGAVHTVGDQLQSDAPSEKALRRLKSAVMRGNLKRHQLGTLKITSSARPSAQYGFACGMGYFYELFEAFHRVGGGLSGHSLAQTAALTTTAASAMGSMMRQLLLDGSSALKPVQARLSIDGHPGGNDFGYLLAASLQRSWLGLRFEQRGAGFMRGDSGRELFARAAKNRVLPGFLRSDARPVKPFSHIHIDSSAGYVVDGELFEPDRPHVLQIKPGPPALFFKY